MREIKVNLDLNNTEKTINVYCSKITGKIKIVYIDEETGEEIKTFEQENLKLTEQTINLIELEGYEIIKVEEERKKLEEIKEKDENKEFNLKEFCNGLSSLGIKLGDDDNE